MELFRENTNEYDKKAILIKFNGQKIGYVPRNHNRILANLMDSGKLIYGIVKDIGVDSVYEGDEFKFISFKLFLKE